MSRYRHEIDNTRAHIISLWLFIILLAIGMAYAFRGWANAPSDITLHIPPDLSSGSSVRVGEVPRPNVYGFAYYMWQQLNRWPRDGAEDFPAKLYRFAAYVTPAFRAELLRDMDRRGRMGELTGRVRALYEAPGAQYADSRVEVLGPNAWSVTIEAVIEETVAGMPVKHTRIRYPLRVVRYDVDRELNPWGMAIDGFAEPGPARVETPAGEED
jgi:integrating conjugative element protein (TIGR03746 family)